MYSKKNFFFLFKKSVIKRNKLNNFTANIYFQIEKCYFLNHKFKD